MRKLICGTAALLGLLVLPPVARAATYTWTGDGQNANWSDPANWGGAAPADDEADVELVFPALTAPYDSNNDRTGLHVVALAVTTQLAAGAYEFTGNPIRLSGMAVLDNPGTGNPNLLWQIPLVLEGDVALLTSGRQTRLQAGIDLGTHTLTFDADSGDVLVSGAISGAGAVIKNGGSALTLGGANSYGGATTGNGGALYITSPTAFGSDAAGTTFFGGSLGFNGAPFAISEPLTFVAGAIIAYGDHTMSGPIVLEAAVAITTFEPTTILTLAGPTAGAGGINKSGPGTLVLTGPEKTYLAATVVDDGDLRIDADVICSNVRVEDGARLLGHASVAGTIDVREGGTLAPGGSPGALACGVLSMVGGASYAAEIDGPQPVSQHDRIEVEGAVTLTGPTLDVTLGYTPLVGQEIVLIDKTQSQPVNGTFAGLGEGALFQVAGTTFGITYRGGSGNDVVLVAGATAAPTATATPAPTGTHTARPVTASATASVTPSPSGAATATPTAETTPQATQTPTQSGQVCVGDCGDDGVVSISDLILGVNILLDNAPVGVCQSFDPDDSGQVTVAELIQGVGNALAGCP